MKERFKRYLETQFRAIRPTLAAAEYRQKTLGQLMDRAQELRIKGIVDEELIYETCIGELGDFQATLVAFDDREQKVDNAKRKIGLGAIIIMGVMAALTVVFLVTSFATGAWSKTWLIMVGGIFAGLIGSAGMVISKLSKKKKYLPIRGLAVVITVLASVFAFLLMQILFSIDNSWLIFLAMVIAIVGIDTAIAFGTDSKFRFAELGVFMEVLCVLLYVILGIVGIAPWHPTWILCLGGVIGSIVIAIVMLAKKNKSADRVEKEKIQKKYVKENDSYYTMWED